MSALQPITFDYRKNDGELTTRHVQPWALKNWHGRWYLTGFDVDRGDERAFRLSRFEGAVRRKRAGPGSYAVPTDHVPEVALEAQAARARGHGRRRGCATAAATPCAAAPSAPTELDERWAEIEVPYRRGTTERDVVALGTHAVAVSPPELVEAVRVGAAGGGPGRTSPSRRPRHGPTTSRRRTGMSGHDASAARRPAETATQRLGRLLDMVPWLLQHQGVPIEEAARGVRRRRRTRSSRTSSCSSSAAPRATATPSSSTPSGTAATSTSTTPTTSPPRCA